MLEFETIGNATLILYDGTPLLVTDPWIDGDAYFGSWGPTHEIPMLSVTPSGPAGIAGCLMATTSASTR
jgi:hypothetical protein